jgi:hypothetical protein
LEENKLGDGDDFLHSNSFDQAKWMHLPGGTGKWRGTGGPTVWRNNIAAIVAHGLIGGVIWFLFLVLEGGWFSGNGTEVPAVYKLLLCALGAGLYVAVGLVLHPQQSAVKNLLSVCSVLIGTLLVWVYCYTVSLSSGEAGLAWILYGLYNASLFPVMTLLPVWEPLYLLPGVVPTLCLWAGLQWKIHRRARRSAVEGS